MSVNSDTDPTSADPTDEAPLDVARAAAPSPGAGLDARPTGSARTTQPMFVVRPSPSIASRDADTNPDPMPPPGAVAQREALDLLQKFRRPLRPPAPHPVQGASSDGRDFVAHYTQTRPAQRTFGSEPAPGVHVLDRLAALARAPSVHREPEGHDLHRDESTSLSSRRRRIVWIVGVAGVAAVLAFAAFVAWPLPAASPIVASSAIPSTRPATPVALPAAVPSATAPSIVMPPVAAGSGSSAATPIATTPVRPRGSRAAPSPLRDHPAPNPAANWVSEEP